MTKRSSGAKLLFYDISGEGAKIQVIADLGCAPPRHASLVWMRRNPSAGRHHLQRSPFATCRTHHVDMLLGHTLRMPYAPQKPALPEG